MKIAIIGAGIAGNAAAWLLSPAHDVVVFDLEHQPGGHANTVDINGHPPMDIGFLAWHERAYPNFSRLLHHFGIESVQTNVSFSVSLGRGKLEYATDNLFLNKSSHLNPGFTQTVREMKRFHHEAPAWLDSKEPNSSLGSYLKNQKYSTGFMRDYMLPVAASMWNVGATEIRKAPARHIFRAMKQHGFLIPRDQQTWFTVAGGSKTYVNALTASFRDKIQTDTAVLSVYRRKNGIETSDKRGNIGVFDHIIFACGADQTLRLLQDATDGEKDMLRSMPYSLSRAYIHQDMSLMPRDRAAWRSGNYLHSTRDGKVCLTYFLNRLQPWLGKKTPYFLTLNPPKEPKNILKEITYSHPSFTGDSLKGWKNLKSIQGKLNTWYCGAWTGMGFHEDALVSGLTVAEAIGPNKRPWDVREASMAAMNCKPEGA